VTNISYFVLRPRGTNPNWLVGYTNNETEKGVSETSANGGITWTNQTYTFDSHLHQFNTTDAFFFFASANYAQNSSTIYDQIGLELLIPTSPSVYFPENKSYLQNLIPINWSSAESGNPGVFIRYNVSLLDENGSYFSNIHSNYSSLGAFVDSRIIPPGEYQVRVMAYDSGTPSLSSSGYSEFFETITNVINETAYYYSATVLDQTKQKYNVTYSYGVKISTVNASFINWNGTILPSNFTSQNAVNGSWNIGSITGEFSEVNVNFVYVLDLANGTRMNYTGKTFTQNITKLTITNCSPTNPLAFATFSFYDEDTRNAINGVNFGISTSIYTNVSYQAYYPFNFTLTANNITLCVNNITNDTVRWNAIAQYSKLATYDERPYYITNQILFPMTNYSLYLAPATLTKKISFSLKEANLLKAPGYFLFINRYFPSNNSYISVAVCKTDDNGICVVPLEAPEPYYQIITFDASGNYVYTFTQIQIPFNICADVCNVNLVLPSASGNSNTSIMKINNTVTSCAYNNLTFVTSCSFTDVSGAEQTVNFTLYNRSNKNAIVCTQQLKTASATFTCSTGTLANNTYYYEVNAHYSDNAIVTLVSGLINQLSAITRNFGGIGIFITILLMIGAGLALAYSPRLAIFTEAVIITAAVFMGFIGEGTGTYNPALLGGLWAIVIAIYYLVRV
jgi:hypothetical protein